MRFSTFSTGFSTTKGHQPYTHRNSGRSFLVSFGQKCGHSAFYKKESRRIFFAFYKPFPSGDLFFSNLEWTGPKFSTPGRCRFSVWKRRGKLQFSTPFFPGRTLSVACGDHREQTERVGCKNKPSRADKVPERAYKTIFYALAAAHTRVCSGAGVSYALSLSGYTSQRRFCHP